MNRTTFVWLSLLQFGGTNTVVPEMHRQAVDIYHWMDSQTFANLFALAQLAPGPNVMIVSLVGWQVAGIAGLSVPCGMTAQSGSQPALPVGLQLLAPAFEEERLFTLAAAVERLTAPNGPLRPPA